MAARRREVSHVLFFPACYCKLHKTMIANQFYFNQDLLQGLIAKKFTITLKD